MGATPKTLLLGAALFAGAAYLHKHKLPEESFHAYCVDHELVEHNSYYATPATACARRKPTTGIYSLLPTGAPWQPWAADDLGLFTLVTTHDGRRFAGALGSWVELPWGARSLAVCFDVLGDVCRILAALALAPRRTTTAATMTPATTLDVRLVSA